VESGLEGSRDYVGCRVPGDEDDRDNCGYCDDGDV